MAMGWLKGLVAPAAQFAGQQLQQGMQPGMQQPGMPQPGMQQPPMGGVPYGVQPGMDPNAMMQQQPAMQQPQGMGFDPSAMQWSTGTKTQGSSTAQAQGLGQGGAVAQPLASPMAQQPQTLEQRCAQLQHDIESLALFARTLLTMLEESKVVTREQFDATKHRLDMLDGKLDDR